MMIFLNSATFLKKFYSSQIISAYLNIESIDKKNISPSKMFPIFFRLSRKQTKHAC